MGRLDGPINEPTCVKNGFPLALVRQFTDGFPVDWVERIARYFYSDSRLTRSLEPDRLFRENQNQPHSARVEAGTQASAARAFVPTPKHATSKRAGPNRHCSARRLAAVCMMSHSQLSLYDPAGCGWRYGIRAAASAAEPLRPATPTAQHHRTQARTPSATCTQNISRIPPPLPASLPLPLPSQLASVHALGLSCAQSAIGLIAERCMHGRGMRRGQNTYAAKTPATDSSDDELGLGVFSPPKPKSAGRQRPPGLVWSFQ